MQFLFIYKPRLLPLGIWLVMCGPPLISLTAKLQVVRLGVRGAPSFAQGTCFLRDWHSGHNYSNPGAELSQMLCHWVALSKEPKDSSLRRGIVCLWSRFGN